MFKYGTKVRVTKGEHNGLTGTVANPLVVELICNKTDTKFEFSSGNCVIVNEHISSYFWFTDEELEEM